MLDRDSAAVRGRAKKKQNRNSGRSNHAIEGVVSRAVGVVLRCWGPLSRRQRLQKKKKSVSLSLSLSLPSLSLSEFELSGVVSPIAPASYPPPPPCTGRRRLTSAPRQRGPGEKGSTPMPNANASNRSGLPKTRPGHNMARASEQHSAPPQAVAGVNFFWCIVIPSLFFFPFPSSLSNASNRQCSPSCAQTGAGFLPCPTRVVVDVVCDSAARRGNGLFHDGAIRAARVQCVLLLRGRTKLCCLGSVRGAGHYYYSIPSMLRALSVFRACCRFNLSACAPHERRDMRRRRCGDEDVSRSVMASAASHPSPLASQQPNNSPCCWAYGQDAELLGNTVYVAPSRLARGVVGAWKGHGCSVACARGGTNTKAQTETGLGAKKVHPSTDGQKYFDLRGCDGADSASSATVYLHT